ncbi:MAG: AmmeMemoRadiSam system protein B [Gammaproteobacteria bacterium]|nr:AmmeMemoRadiSam system protein B [Gammaproteobacteria bacterium]
MTRLRNPAVAGTFYPADAAELRSMLNNFLAPLKPAQETAPVPKAMIVPHAGYIYSGPVAASAYRLLWPARNNIRRVVLLGPSHRVPLFGLAASSADAFNTPLGQIALDKVAITRLLELPQVKLMDQAHTLEHSLEVQLPFLQTVLNDFTLVPLVVGEASPQDVAEVLDVLWDGDETLILISSDLSHYHDYNTARHMDQATSKAIEQLKPETILYDDACGRNGINGLLLAAQEHGLQARTIDLRSSGDTADPRDQVVGYGAYVFEPHH